jgi:hypothetical protein
LSSGNRLPQRMIYTIDIRPVAEEAIRRLELRMEPAELLDSLTVERVEHASTDPHHARRAEASLPGNAYQRQLETVERVRRIRNANGLCREWGYLNWGIVLRES